MSDIETPAITNRLGAVDGAASSFIISNGGGIITGTASSLIVSNGGSGTVESAGNVSSAIAYSGGTAYNFGAEITAISSSGGTIVNSIPEGVVPGEGIHGGTVSSFIVSDGGQGTNYSTAGSFTVLSATAFNAGLVSAIVVSSGGALYNWGPGSAGTFTVDNGGSGQNGLGSGLIAKA